VSSYFSPRLPVMRVVWEESVLTWMVFTGPPSALDSCTFGTLAGALVPEVEGSFPPSSRRAASAARACSFSTIVITTARSLRMVRTPAGDDILRTKYP
jgi:hypothetical protein